RRGQGGDRPHGDACRPPGAAVRRRRHGCDRRSRRRLHRGRGAEWRRALSGRADTGAHADPARGTGTGDPAVRSDSVAARFCFVGLIGFGVQVLALALLTHVAHWTWPPATIAAVECAIVHNYWWHERWTWRERSAGFS